MVETVTETERFGEGRVSVELVAHFAAPIQNIYDTCFGAVAALRARGGNRASVGVHSRGLPYIQPANNWGRFRYKGRLSSLYDECRDQLPPEEQVGACHIEDAGDRWAAAYCRDDKLDGLPADPFLYLSYDGGTPKFPGFPDGHNGVVQGITASQEFFRVVDVAGDCYFGFADVNANALRGGQLYSSFPARPMTWRQEVEHVDWWSSGEKRRERVRDVYWGMYLSARMLERLPRDLLDRFLEVETEDEKPQTVTRYESGAAFLTMSVDPLDAPFPFPFGPESPAVCNAVWLRQRLREAGLL
jgi:hypothetical protein